LHLLFGEWNKPLSGTQLRELDSAIRVIAALPLLESLKLEACRATSCCLKPLVHAPALRSLTLIMERSALKPQVNIDALRQMPHLRSLHCTSSSSILRRLLELPHTMKLELLAVFHPLTEGCGEAFPHLPSLTNLSFALGYPNVDFLRQLPDLRSLNLDCTRCSRPADMDRMMASFQSLTGLTELRLYGNGYVERPHTLRFTSARLAACLPHLPLLSSLHMLGTLGVDSLCFLSSGPITRSLTELKLAHFRPRLPLSRELEQIHALSSLSSLQLESVFDRRMDEQTLRLYTPPSLLLPALREFEYEFDPSDDEEEDEEEGEEEAEED
jgi:hypothetical protein